ncbi:SMI1/KNR4 family protein [Bacillus sp. FJAT-27916]
MAEAKLKVTLPASYIELLKQQNGGRFTQCLPRSAA